MTDRPADQLTRLELFRAEKAYLLPAIGRVRGTLTAGSTGTGRRFVIYLPPEAGDGQVRSDRSAGHDRGRSDRSAGSGHPVLYHLHGAAVRFRWVHKDIRWIAAANEAAVAAGVGEPMAIVGAHDQTQFSMWTDSADGSNRQASGVLDDLIPHIEQTYPVRTERWSRYLQGFSMGGFGAVSLGLQHQDLFGAIAVWDGALHDWESINRNRPGVTARQFNDDAAYFDRWSPWRLAERADLPRSPVALFTGLLPEWAERFDDHLQANGGQVIRHAVKRLHDLRYLERTLGHHLFELLADVAANKLP